MSNFFVTQGSQETEWITMKALVTPLPCRAWHALLFPSSAVVGPMHVKRCQERAPSTQHVLCVHRWLQWCQEIAPCTQICTTSLLSRLSPRAPGNGEAALCSALLGQCACELDEGLRNRYLPSRGTPTACPTMARNSPTVAVARCSRKALRNSSSMRFKNFAFE